MGLSDRLEKHKKQFDELVNKIKECDENIKRTGLLRDQLISERDIAKGRYNEIKELIDEEKAKPVVTPS